MSIGGTSLNSEQLLSQLQNLQQKGLGNRHLVLDSNGKASAKTLFQQFCNWFTCTPSSPKQSNELQQLQAMLERDYGSVDRRALLSLT
ncbi:MAG: hypothetical protein LBE99_04345, partial [Puniceicoccales bacterium]|nr:hypothetical protein [Puniceicoccales bacterium]